MRKILAWAFVFALLAGVTWWALDLRQRSEDMAKAVDELRRKLVQTITNTWKSGGMDVTVTTVRKDNEDLDAWRARHREAVAAMRAEYPPDP